MNINELFDKKDQFYLHPSRGWQYAIYASMILGVGLVGFGFWSLESRTVWGTLLFNLFFFFCLGLGGVAVSAILDVIGAIWARPFKRLWESFGAFVPVAAAFFTIFLIAVYFDIGGAQATYNWIVDPGIVAHFYGKNVWLSGGFMVLRSLLILSAIVACVLWQLKQSVGRDMVLLNDGEAEARRLGEETREKLRFWCGGILIVYGVGLTFFGMDLMMSLSPLWFSTLFGGWQFAILMQTLFATTLLFFFRLKSTRVGVVLNRTHFHDVGKLMHGFTVFFAYTTYAHILTYWYGNVPEETEYFIHRMHEPWLYLLFLIPVIAFIIPLYTLVFKAAKWTWYVTIPLAVMILTGQWFTNMLVVMPEVSPVTGSFGVMPLVAFGGFLFFLGVFFSTFFWFSRRYPMIGLADPLLAQALDSGHH